MLHIPKHPLSTVFKPCSAYELCGQKAKMKKNLGAFTCDVLAIFESKNGQHITKTTLLLYYSTLCF